MTTLTPRPTVLVAAEHLAVETSRGERLVDDVSLEVRAGELVAVVGPSGAGKTTLLQALAGLRSLASGNVDRAALAGAAGYVPQDDIVHTELTVAESVRYAARLHYGRSLAGAELDDLVAGTLASVGLSDRADQVVASVSGGQRKRVSIAVELVAHPAVCFLDEPTSGLDPTTADDLMTTLASLAAGGTAVVLTTHNLADLQLADRVVAVAPGGRVDFDGPPDLAPAAYRPVCAVADRHPPAGDAVDTVRAGAARPRSRPTAPAPRRGQVGVLTRRNVTVLARNRMSAAIMAGSPVAVVTMMAILFRSDTAGPGAQSADVAHAFAYWLAFAGFFFGLTFGLLQICTELPIVRRELHGPVRLDAYLLAKAAVLVPVLVAVNVLMVGVLMGIGRIGWTGTRDLALLLGLLALDSLAGLAIGLLASAAVTGPVQATLALPMLCFPAVLFGGAIVPVDAMTSIGRALSATTSTRWSFDTISDVLVPGTEHGAGAVAALSLIAVLAAIGTRAVLAHRTRTAV